MWKVVLWAQILLLVGCGSGPQFCDYYDPQDLQSPRTFQVMNASPIVLVGTVRSTTVISRGLPARKQSTLRLDLMKAEITVENSLRAALQSTDAQFYYFEFSPMNGGYSGPPRYHLDRADRRVFFLTRDSGVLRSSGDVLDYTLRVQSGRHKSSLFSLSDFGGSISRILLTRGEHYVGGAMARSISYSAPISDRFSSRAQTVALLQQLVSETQDDVSGKACFELAQRYYGQYGCLSAIVGNPLYAVDVRTHAKELLVAQTRNNALLKNELRTYPLLALTKCPFPDDLEAIREELRMLASDPDSSIRVLACSALQKNYPDAEPKCRQPN